eukprot:CAMPEP_0113961798 /NCGR_PEP_ID=MMETSP0011_2-20120614/5533_1 /TAXON_ID=101924 /ORGANISM="Rhodosorus marinus" /LENGTH=425 /DNA_ID=CAMNT_0000973527 /DNA_START=103 /DNA_END=1380 /DNA_ORIENTATION=+ /assembly_acc=CAM_ASM_000156
MTRGKRFLILWVWLFLASKCEEVPFHYIETNPSFMPRELVWSVVNSSAYIAVDQRAQKHDRKAYDVKDSESLLFSFGRSESSYPINDSMRIKPVESGRRPMITTRVINPDSFPSKQDDFALFDFSLVLDSVLFHGPKGDFVRNFNEIDWQPMTAASQNVYIPAENIFVNTTIFRLSSTDGSLKVVVGAGGSMLKFPYGIVTPYSLAVAIEVSTGTEEVYDKIGLSTLICSPGKKTLSHSEVFGRDPFVGIKSKYKMKGQKTRYRGYLAWNPWIRMNGYRFKEKLKAKQDTSLDDSGDFVVEDFSHKYGCAMVNISSAFSETQISPSSTLEWQLRVGFGPTPPLYRRTSLWLPVTVVVLSLLVISIGALYYVRMLRLSSGGGEESARQLLLEKSSFDEDELERTYSSVKILGAYDGKPPLLRSAAN